MSIDQIAAEALRLAPREWALLAESLWESLEEPFRAPCDMDDKSALSLALERDRQMQSGEIQTPFARGFDGQAAAMMVDYHPAVEAELEDVLP